jgi:hypothetical protein
MNQCTANPGYSTTTASLPYYVVLGVVVYQDGSTFRSPQSENAKTDIT